MIWLVLLYDGLLEFGEDRYGTKKKSKKAVGNPARGFATTSVASKTKLHTEDSAESPATVADPEGFDHSQEPNGGDVPREQDLHELSPEELENQLKESDLQIFLDKHCAKVRKDVTRHIHKLQTEKRLLRPQAESLQTRSWLPPEMMEMIMQTVEAEQLLGGHAHRSKDGCIDSELSEDDLCIKIWTLRQVLVQLGFSFDLCHGALRYLLAIVHDSTTSEPLAGGDNVWGLDCCLDWLALHCDAQEAPSYSLNHIQTVNAPFSEQQQAKIPGASSSDEGEFPHLALGTLLTLSSNH